ncbi:MAG: zinc dependent phospholipase C family protein, partial [Acidobacteriaceae bacterium]|nr:zinc dependent phospholipase C family protein [Acidobacteriaceae bacterium]
MSHPCRFRRGLVALICLVLLWTPLAPAYSVLAHETIIDAAWSNDIVPVLRQRFPHVTPEELNQAHAYAYGGAIIQDMGYYPYGSEFFSDLAHYVRSGDFIVAMLRDSQDLNEYAFALGAMAHYAADNQGHRLATNRAVPVLYPKIRKKYGNVVTYEDDPLAHLKTEFGFDVLEVAKGRFPADAYHAFIGFDVARPLLDRAFRETYGIPLDSVLKDEDKAIGSYRHAVSKTIPEATKVAWQLKKDQIQKDIPGITRQKFLYNISRAKYEKSWGTVYQKPTFKEKFLAFVVRILPKVGKLRALTFRTPTPQTEKFFEESFNATLDQYRRLLKQVREKQLVLPNENFDVGAETGPGEYHLEDKTYAELLDRLADQKYAGMSAELRSDILRYYSNAAAANSTKNNPKAWAKVQTELEQL